MMTTTDHDSFGPIYIQPPVAADPVRAQGLRSFMSGARIATHLALSATILSVPGWRYMDFDPSKGTPGWAAALFVMGVLGFLALVFLIPVRIIGRVILFVVGDGTSRADAWLRFGFVVAMVAIISAGVTCAVLENRSPSPMFPTLAAAPTTTSVSP